jgi:hypothetical protein
MGADAVLLENGVALGVLDEGLEDDEILAQEVRVNGAFDELLAEQFAAPSGVGAEVEEQELILGLGLAEGLVERSLEHDALGRSRGGQSERRGD